MRTYDRNYHFGLDSPQCLQWGRYDHRFLRVTHQHVSDMGIFQTECHAGFVNHETEIQLPVALQQGQISQYILYITVLKNNII